MDDGVKSATPRSVRYEAIRLAAQAAHGALAAEESGHDQDESTCDLCRAEADRLRIQRQR